MLGKLRPRWELSSNILFEINLGGSSNPSFMPEDYAISSASCGVEKIDIKRTFKRPINIAVYGHPYYEVCVNYTMKNTGVLFK